jgi:flagellar biosynthesis anti-sigma factor FlgM
LLKFPQLVPIEQDEGPKTRIWRNRCGAKLKYFNARSILELQGEFKTREPAMRIDLNHEPQQVSETNLTNAQNATTRPSAGNGLGDDQAQLSGAGAQVEALAAQASQLPEVRQERVQALRQAVQGGQYQASPEQVAGAMFAHLLAGSAA